MGMPVQVWPEKHPNKKRLKSKICWLKNPSVYTLIKAPTRCVTTTCIIREGKKNNKHETSLFDSIRINPIAFSASVSTALAV